MQKTAAILGTSLPQPGSHLVKYPRETAETSIDFNCCNVHPYANTEGEEEEEFMMEITNPNTSIFLSPAKVQQKLSYAMLSENEMKIKLQDTTIAPPKRKRKQGIRNNEKWQKKYPKEIVSIWKIIRTKR